MTTKYPEHDKLMAVKEQSQTIGEFLDYGLGNQGITLCQHDEETGRFWPTSKPIQQILADYFEIDLNKIETEKRAMLDELRSKA